MKSPEYKFSDPVDRLDPSYKDAYNLVKSLIERSEARVKISEETINRAFSLKNLLKAYSYVITIDEKDSTKYKILIFSMLRNQLLKQEEGQPSSLIL